MANSSFFFFFFSKKYGECFGSSFLKFLPRRHTRFFFCHQLVKFRQKKKHFYIIWPFLRVQQNLNHMGCSDAIHGWMTGRMDGWKASWKTTITSFTICNYMKHTTSLITWLLVHNNCVAMSYICMLYDWFSCHKWSHGFHIFF